MFLWPNGDMYEGNYKNDLRHGYGVFTNPDGMKYEGMWEND